MISDKQEEKKSFRDFFVKLCFRDEKERLKKGEDLTQNLRDGGVKIGTDFRQ